MLRSQLCLPHFGLLTAAAARPGEDSRGGLEEAAPRTRCDPSRAVKVVPDARGIYFSAYPETVGVDACPGSPTKHRRQIARFNTLAGKRLAFSMCSTRCWAAGSSSLQGGTRGVGFGRRAADLDSAPLELEHARERQPDPILSLEMFARGDRDPGLRRWARAARASRVPMLVACGQEVSSGWPNITWLYWTGEPSPKATWNHDRYLYPGDGHVDWVGGAPTATSRRADTTSGGRSVLRWTGCTRS